MNENTRTHAIDINSIERGGERLSMANEEVAIEVKSLDLYYGEVQALRSINMHIPRNRVTAFIGPSGCGKSTLLRCFNRMNDLVDNTRVAGQVLLDGSDIYSKSVNVADLRRRVGMVFQKPNPFPKSIYENVAYGLRIQGVKRRRVLDEAVEKSLRGAALWDEVKDRLSESALGLSGGQQQRLVIARSIAVEPEVLLLDEPASALDPIATATLEELIDQLRGHYTIVIITHNMQQAARVSQRVAVFHLGEMVEYGDAATIFVRPQHPLTQAYITGRFG